MPCGTLPAVSAPAPEPARNASGLSTHSVPPDNAGFRIPHATPPDPAHVASGVSAHYRAAED
eukprot:14223874-Alexandrium_andersonii.AAC.1